MQNAVRDFFFLVNKVKISEGLTDIWEKTESAVKD